MAEPRRPTSRHGLSRESPLLGYHPHAGVLDLPPEPEPAPEQPVELRDLRELVPGDEPERQLDDWEIRARIQLELDELRASRRSVWFG